jgi:4-amino-4-deoxy-L-arabinose transferase-like glycosyltransferase
MHPPLNGSSIKSALNENYPIISLLIGVLLVSFSIGLFQNPDTTWEFKAANGVLEWGMPYTEVQGSLINQPPLGFYAEALFMRIFGVSIETGTILVTLFGLDCIYLVYRIGKELYSKQSGLIAAALFALTPWQLVLSRSFLIDTQCLFLSLLTLFLGIIAVKANSNKKFLAAGVVFAFAFLTKLYAVFVLLPLIMVYLYHRKLSKRLIVQAAVFLVPLALSLLVWNQIHDWMLPGWLPRGLGYMFNHSDFRDFNPEGVVPVYSFISTFLLDEALGYFFVAAVVTSLAVGLAFRKHLQKDIVAYDWMFAASILAILGLNVYLGVTLNLKVPYTSAVKYVYQALPWFSLIAASLIVKGASLWSSAKSNSSNQKAVLVGCAVFGLMLILAAVFVGVIDAHELSHTEFIIFNVQPGMLLGYSFNNTYTITDNNPAMYLQYVGFILIASGLIYASKRFITANLQKKK